MHGGAASGQPASSQTLRPAPGALPRHSVLLQGLCPDTAGTPGAEARVSAACKWLPSDHVTARGGGLGISAHPLEKSAKDHQGPEVGHLLGTLGSWAPPPRTQRLKIGGGGEVGDTAVLDGQVL